MDSDSQMTAGAVPPPDARAANALEQGFLTADPVAAFAQHHDSSVDATYTDRADRNRFAAARLRSLGARSVLNVGGGGARHLQSHLGREPRVFEIDMTGDCDLKLNLDRIEALPFADRTFDVCCAFDVLEHLENFHLINEELLRVAERYVLISLPNSAAEIPYRALRNERQQKRDWGTYSQFYGLPLVAPEDRHRWWMYFQDIVRFYTWFAHRHDCALEFWTPRPQRLRKKIFKAVVGSRLYHTFFCPTVWVKLSRRG